jgi:hypothetical protein
MASLTLRKTLYGAAFLVLLPFLLVLWAGQAERNVGLPPFGSLGLGHLGSMCRRLVETATAIWILRRAHLGRNLLPVLR